jgi:hypothetical protein
MTFIAILQNLSCDGEDSVSEGVLPVSIVCNIGTWHRFARWRAVLLTALEFQGHDPYQDCRLTANGRLRIVLNATIGKPTNGMWPKNWIHHRTVIVGGLWVNAGMTAHDITIQISGP